MDEFGQWGTDRAALINAEITKMGAGGNTSNPNQANAVYSTVQWQLVKMWELMQEYQLEGYGPVIYGTTYGEPRTWFVDTAFKASPFMLRIPFDQTGINGSGLLTQYLASAWWQLQLTLNNSNHANVSSSPIDWPYVYGPGFDGLHQMSQGSNALQFVEYLNKGMQISDNGIGPDKPLYGWRPDTIARVELLVYPNTAPMFSVFDAGTKKQIYQSMLQAWFTKTSQYTPAQYYAGGMASPTYVPRSMFDGPFGDITMWMIPQFQAAGVDPNLLNQITNWAATVWPLGNWKPLLIAVPAPVTGGQTGGAVAVKK
jgi:hypothetical protein